MRKYLLPHGLPFFKANLHCHSTESDGKLTPEELKADYQSKGYSVIAYTDHEILVPHPHLNDESFLALNGYELEVLDDYPEGSTYHQRKTCHLCLIALEPDNQQQVYWNRRYINPKIAAKHSQLIKTYENQPDMQRVFSGEGITAIMQAARNCGYFVTYNHPCWSLVDISELETYHGMHALELYNHMSFSEGYDDYNTALYDAMLRRNERILCIAADDNHVPEWQFGGFTMICAENLEYRTITKALENGHFYASTGPLIHQLWFEDGNIHIRCSPAAKIFASYGIRKRVSVRKTDTDLTEAAFPVHPNDVFVRITVWDADHNHADTNAYFVDELFRES